MAIKKTSPTKPKSKKKKKEVDKRLPKLTKVGKVKKKVHPQFGTSKLEQNFAVNFLDKLGVKYEWQYEAKDIKRFYDYYLPEHRILIEIDGGYYHADPRLYEGKDLNKMQKHNKRVDSCKDNWAALHGIPLIRIWEKDINENPSSVMAMLRKKLHIAKETIDKQKEKNKRHVNKMLNIKKEKPKNDGLRDISSI